MQQNINPYLCQNSIPQMPCANPNAVNINIIQPQAYASGSECSKSAQNFYPFYQTNPNPNLPLYPMNYNNMFYPQPYNQQNNGLNQNNLNQKQPYYTQNQQDPIQNQSNQNGIGNSANALNGTNLLNKTENSEKTSTQNSSDTESTKKDEKNKKPKSITILTDNYIKSLENYLNDSNPKMRLIAAKEIMERFKEDDSRIANPSLVALLNKTLRDTSPSVRFLGLTALQLGYSVGNDETVEILKEIQKGNQDKLGEDAVLASEILLKLSAPRAVEVK